MTELIEGIDFYYNKEGLVVLTEQYHLEKGYCCGNGCLHCPYKNSTLNAQKVDYEVPGFQSNIKN